MYICAKRGKPTWRVEPAHLRSWPGDGWGSGDAGGGGQTREGKCPSLGHFISFQLKKNRGDLLGHVRCLSGAGRSPEMSPAPGWHVAQAEWRGACREQKHTSAEELGWGTSPPSPEFPSFIPGPREILVTPKSCNRLKMMREMSPAFLLVPASGCAFQKLQP